MDAIKAQKEYLEHVYSRIEKLAQKKSPAEELEKLVTPLLASFKVPSTKHQKYAQRLRYGLYHYYARHYHPTSSTAGEE